MRLTTSDGLADPAKEADIKRELAKLLDEPDSFVVLSASSDEADQHYVQACAAPDEPTRFIVEYRSGGPSSHFRSANHLELGLVISLFRAYLNGDPNWHQGVRWKSVDLEQEHRTQVERDPDLILAREKAFLNVFLGTVLGAKTDIGETDDEILAQCKKVLAMIRQMKESPDAMAAMVAFQSTIPSP